MEPIITPNRMERALDLLGALPNIGSLLFPRFPEQLKSVDSSLLTGSTFVIIVIVLSSLLVLVVVVDCFIIYNLNKSNKDDGNEFGEVFNVGGREDKFSRSNYSHRHLRSSNPIIN